MEKFLRALVGTLDNGEIGFLYRLLWEEQFRRFKENSSLYECLTEEEKNLAKKNKIQAIKAYRERTTQGLNICKWMVESYLEG